ncbi:hypothetical protein EV426DRAFT_678914 [Tirmania nivea]|nr:hypothetical protein EV426DRAFT_678914 [Tirmania nivea]
MASYRSGHGSIGLDSDSDSDSSSGCRSGSDSATTAIPRGRTPTRRDTSALPPARSQSSPAPSYGDPIFERDQVQGPYYTTEVLFDKLGAFGRTTDSTLVRVDGLGEQLRRQMEDVEQQVKESKDHTEERLEEMERSAAARHEELVERRLAKLESMVESNREDHEELVEMMGLREGKIITLLEAIASRIEGPPLSPSPEVQRFMEFFDEVASKCHEPMDIDPDPNAHPYCHPFTP